MTPLSFQNPSSRATFTEYCLRRLGKGAININVTDEQVRDRIDDALKFWWDYHFEGTEKAYYKYQLTALDIANKYIILPDNIIGAIMIWEAGDTFNTGNMFNIRYQIMLNDLYTLTSVSVVPYFMTMQHLAFLQELFVGTQPIRYNRHNNRLYVDMDWSRYSEGQYLLVEAYQIVDPDVYTHAWSDRWLLSYATALIKRQWGEQLKKYGNMQMPGGIVFNGQQIYNEAIQEIADIEHEIIHSYSLPVTDFIG
jgi:hypothetical protein